MSSRALRVALDFTQVDNQTLGSGQFRYSVDLVNGLCGLDAGIQLTLLGSALRPVPEVAAVIGRFPDRCRYVPMAAYRGPGYYYYDLARLSSWLAVHRMDLLHQLHTNIPPLKPCPVVATAYHYFEDAVLFATRPFRYYRWALRHRADLVIAISDATREDFHRHLGVPRERMRTVYPGLSQSLAPTASPPATGRYILSPYNLSGPKNLRSLIAAWPAIAERDGDIELILYGRALVTPTSEAAFEALLGTTAHADRIRRVGHVTDGELSALYAGCSLFVFPTIVEGFGYPLLEAMAHGACCITRDASAMREIGGDAVRLVETLEPEEISAAAIDLLANPSLRAKLGAAARQRAATFTVEAMSRNTLECYLAVARGARIPA